MQQPFRDALPAPCASVAMHVWAACHLSGHGHKLLSRSVATEHEVQSVTCSCTLARSAAHAAKSTESLTHDRTAKHQHNYDSISITWTSHPS